MKFTCCLVLNSFVITSSAPVHTFTFSKAIGHLHTYLIGPDRSGILMRCIFDCITTIVEGGGSGHSPYRGITIYKACIRLPLTQCSVIQCFESGYLIKIHNGITFNFYPGLSRTLYIYCTYLSGYIVIDGSLHSPLYSTQYLEACKVCFSHSMKSSIRVLQEVTTNKMCK